DVAFLHECRVTGRIAAGVGGGRYVARKLTTRLIEHRHVRARIDLKQHLTRLNRLAFGEVDAVENSVDLRLDGDRLHWFSDAGGGDYEWDGRSLDGGATRRPVRWPTRRRPRDTGQRRPEPTARRWRVGHRQSPHAAAQFAARNKRRKPASQRSDGLDRRTRR